MTEQFIPWPDWQIVKIIGRGSYGTVYEIQRTLASGETESAALKVIKIPQSPADIESMYSEGFDAEAITETFREHLKGIMNEYELMQKLDGHTNIVNSKDISSVQHDDGMGWDIFIRMELLTPLMQSLTNEITDEMVINLGIDICKALQLCNKQNIIHRDIKPQNIFVSKNGDYKLGDFGIAKVVEQTVSGTRTGTYEYMAPEVYFSRPYGQSADVYSLGLVLYWMLNDCRLPFIPPYPEKITASHAEKAKQRRFNGEKIQEPAHGSPELKVIVLKACAFDPKNRYNSADELLLDLKKAKNGTYVVSILNGNLSEEKTIGPDWKKTPEEPNGGNKKVILAIVLSAILIVGVIALVVGLVDFDAPAPPVNNVDNFVSSQAEKCFISADTTEINIGETAELAFHVGEYIYRQQDNLQWTSSNSSVATINKSGIVTGIEEGAAVISAEMDGKTAQIEITINKASESAGAGQSITSASQTDTTSVKSLELCANTDVILLKDEIGLYLKADGWMLEGESSGIKFSTSDSYVATVDQNGLLRANAVGTCIVTAEYGGKTATKEIKVVKVNENSSAMIRSQFENVNLSSGGSTDVMIYFEGNLPEHYNVSVYACGNFQIGLKWGQIQNNAAKLTISDTYSFNRTGEITLLLFAEDNPDVAMAAIKIPINIS